MSNSVSTSSVEPPRPASETELLPELQIERAGDDLVGIEGERRLACERAPAERAVEVLQIQRGVRAFLQQLATGVEREAEIAGPASDELAGIERTRAGVYLPADAGFQQHGARRREIAGLLHDGELFDLDLFGRAVDVEIDGGELAGRADGEVAVGGEGLRRAVHLHFAMRAEWLADPFLRELDVFPGDVEVGVEEGLYCSGIRRNAPRPSR